MAWNLVIYPHALTFWEMRPYLKSLAQFPTIIKLAATDQHQSQGSEGNRGRTGIRNFRARLAVCAFPLTVKCGCCVDICCWFGLELWKLPRKKRDLAKPDIKWQWSVRVWQLMEKRGEGTYRTWKWRVPVRHRWPSGASDGRCNLCCRTHYRHRTGTTRMPIITGSYQQTATHYR